MATEGKTFSLPDRLISINSLHRDDSIKCLLNRTGPTLVFTRVQVQLCHWIPCPMCLFLQTKMFLLITFCCLFNSGSLLGLSCWDPFFSSFTDDFDQFQESSHSGSSGNAHVRETGFLLSTLWILLPAHL